jgi:hypothetical protein
MKSDFVVAREIRGVMAVVIPALFWGENQPAWIADGEFIAKLGAAIYVYKVNCTRISAALPQFISKESAVIRNAMNAHTGKWSVTIRIYQKPFGGGFILLGVDASLFLVAIPASIETVGLRSCRLVQHFDLQKLTDTSSNRLQSPATREVGTATFLLYRDPVRRLRRSEVFEPSERVEYRNAMDHLFYGVRVWHPQ